MMKKRILSAVLIGAGFFGCSCLSWAQGGIPQAPKVEILQGEIEERPNGAGIYLPQQEAFIPFANRENQNNDSDPKAKPADVSKGALKEVPLRAGIWTLDGELVGWVEDAVMKIKKHALPTLGLDPAVSEKYVALDNALLVGIDFSIWRKLHRQELKKISEQNFYGKTQMDAHLDQLKVGQADQNGKITDRNGVQIAMLEQGAIIFNPKSWIPHYGLDLDWNVFSYPNIIGLVDAKGDILDLHHRLAGHLDGVADLQDKPNLQERLEAIQSNEKGLLEKAYKQVKQYEKAHPWPKKKK
ncbi:hypothetical protein FAI41_07840 [Acetobacteraceae bacterium]|nr:hypothetical protein FAI41_07840 [Acetobacteraceae bacterium]